MQHHVFWEIALKSFAEEIPPSPLSIFKCTTYEHIDQKERKIELLFENWPFALIGEGCSVNKNAGKVLTSDIGLLSPTTRCSAHAASGTMHQITTSKTMSIPEVVTFTSGIKPILKHFQLSGKSSALLQQCLEIMDMKPSKLMTWCPTWMVNLLECNTQDFVSYFWNASNNWCQRRRSILLSFANLRLSVSSIYDGDLEEVFVSKLLRKLDADEATLFDVFRLSETITNSMNDLKTPLFDSFLGGLSEDNYGNVKYMKFDEKGHKNSIMLNHQHQPSQRTMSKKNLPVKKAESSKGE